MTNPPQSGDPNPEDDVHAVQRLQDAYHRIGQEISKVIVGQEEVLEQLMIPLFAGGHCLLVGVPGLAKTMMIRSIAQALSLEFRRIQFTPDLMPSDITGTEVIQENKSTGERQLRFAPGPVFGNIILADEINRTPPKTQAALLEAMQEQQVTVAGKRHTVPNPFFVMATQNPIEHEGTYPLPEAQLDRFMFQVNIDYPSEDEELEIVKRTTTDIDASIQPSLTSDDIVSLTRIVRRIPIADHVARYAIQFSRRTRPDKKDSPDFIKENVQWGAGPRASQNLVLGAKARAALGGRYHVSCEDIRAVALPVLRHRIRPSFLADSEGVAVDEIIRRLVESIPVVDDRSHDGQLGKILRSKGAR